MCLFLTYNLCVYVCICSIGASVVVETQPVPSLFSRSYYNRLCFLQFDRQVEDTILPEEWENVSALVYILTVCVIIILTSWSASITRICLWTSTKLNTCFLPYIYARFS